MQECKDRHSVDEKSRGASSEEDQVGQDGRYLFNLKGPVFPSDTYETDDRAKKVLADLQREQKFRVQSPSLLVDDLKELGMYYLTLTLTLTLTFTQILTNPYPNPGLLP